MNQPLKAYNITSTGANDAVVEMYGEVVESRPWWAEEEEAYIVAQEFLADLDRLESKDHITVHINSVGGDLYAGLSIYNRLKALSGEVTTINDGLAASAASLIFQAGDKRQMHTGSNLMVHQTAALLFDYYQASDLNSIISQLEAHDKAIVNVYAEASGRPAADMRALVEAETWMTGQEAVDEGLADEVIGAEAPVTAGLTGDGKFIVVNGVSLPTRGMRNIPSGLPVIPEPTTQLHADPPASNTTNKERTDHMDTPIKTLAELRDAYPDLMEQARAEAFAAGAESERTRIQGIEAIQDAVVDKSLINEAKYGDKPMTAEQLAFRAMSAQAAAGVRMVADLQADTADSGVNGVAADPTKPGNDPQAQAKADMQAAIDFMFKKKEAK